MKILLDTHPFLWWIADDPRLISKHKDRLEDSQQEIFLSMASLWEMAIKVSLGKLNLGVDFKKFFKEYIQDSTLELLPIQSTHLLELANLPFHHKDPFDRLLLCQAKAEGMVLMTKDKKFKKYKGIKFL